MAANVPMWRATSKVRLFSNGLCQPKSQGIRARCAVLLMGANSVMPCTAPSRSACQSSVIGPPSHHSLRFSSPRQRMRSVKPSRERARATRHGLLRNYLKKRRGHWFVRGRLPPSPSPSPPPGGGGEKSSLPPGGGGWGGGG